jgi:hypothetical protein
MAVDVVISAITSEVIAMRRADIETPWVVADSPESS